MTNLVTIVTTSSALVLLLVLTLLLRVTTEFAAASSLAVRTDHHHRHRQQSLPPITTTSTTFLLSARRRFRRRRTLSSPISSDTTTTSDTTTATSITAGAGAATRAVTRVHVHLGTQQRQRHRQRPQLRQQQPFRQWRRPRPAVLLQQRKQHDVPILATTGLSTRDDVGKDQPGYGYTDQRCEDDSSCISPRQCLFVGSSICSDAFSVCYCKIPYDRQSCRSSADCLAGDRCYQFAPLLERRCISCSLKGTVYVRNQGFRPVDNGWTCIGPGGSNGNESVSPSETPGVMASSSPNTNTSASTNSTNGGGVTIAPSASPSPTVKVTSNSSLVPGLIGGISVAVIVPTFIILLICFKMSHSNQ